jgi:hypothetical protein
MPLISNERFFEKRKPGMFTPKNSLYLMTGTKKEIA